MGELSSKVPILPFLHVRGLVIDEEEDGSLTPPFNSPMIRAPILHEWKHTAFSRHKKSPLLFSPVICPLTPHASLRTSTYPLTQSGKDVLET